MPEFTPGLKLNELFYHEIVKPILDAEYPNLIYSAARLGSGSDVLGYDDEISTDHDWELRFHLFVSEEDKVPWGTAVHNTLPTNSPPAFAVTPLTLAIRQKLAYFPRDVWLYLLAAQ